MSILKIVIHFVRAAFCKKHSCLSLTFKTKRWYKHIMCYKRC